MSSFGCKVCGFKDVCPFYTKDRIDCIILKKKKEKFDLVDKVELLELLLEEKMDRYLRAKLFEELSGGQIKSEVTTIEDGIVRLVEVYMKLRYPQLFKAGGKYSPLEEKKNELMELLREVEGDDDESSTIEERRRRNKKSKRKAKRKV